MRRGSATALAAFLGIAAFSTHANGADDGYREPHRFYDRETECAVFDTRGFAATAANWDGPCMRGLANGRGTATFFGRNESSQTVSASFRDGVMLDGEADIRWSDGAQYSGDIADGTPDGTGVLVNGKGDRFEGMWKAGQLSGHGSVAWANGDRYEGDWVDGKAEGHGVQVWADGQKYDGAWHNDQPNGQGTVTRKDGSTFTAMFVDGKRQETAAATPQAAAPPAPAKSSGAATPASQGAPVPELFEGMSGITLSAVDGSTVSLTTTEGGVVRTLAAADGTVQTSVFAFLGPNLGTVADQADPRRVSGLFRVTADGVVVEYSDGRSEILRRDPSGGLLVTAKSASGGTVCASWYPQGHVFSVAERRAAVVAYARRLGVGDSTTAANGCANQLAPAATPGARPPAHRPASPAQHAANAPSALLSPKPVNSSGLQTVPVKDSNVHLIDTPAGSNAAPPGVAASPAEDERIASNCLRVDSDGSYWGFRNHCGYSVQFAYCLLHGVNPITACRDKGAVSGSVSANGFGALFADESLGERDAEHQFRWVGCRGGAGEVIAQLDHADPASGQCVRTKTAQRDNN
jgi:hypothetical protein